MPACASCGDDVTDKNAAGHYRDLCEDCIDAIAAETPSHHEQCGDPDCIVCQDYDR